MLVAALSQTALSSDGLPRTADIVTIDGKLDDAAWASALRIELDVETEPGENIAARVHTAVFIIEDGENLFVAFDAEDPHPDAIRAYLRDRDSAWEDDYVGITLDTYNNERRAFQFYVNPLGVQMDRKHDEFGANRGRRWDIDASWDAIWDSAGHIHDGGYVVEMRIPLTQLRFPDGAAEKTWGYDVERNYPRDRTYRFSSAAIDRNRNCYLCQVGKLQGLEGSEPGSDFEIVPTLTASHAASTDEPASVPIGEADTTVEGGITARWGITPDLTANLALNPDFSQVESDVAQLDVNNRFALFYPEKRPFFLEGSDYFNTPIDAVFSRTIADPDVGAKLTGQRGAHTFGAFAARDAETNLLFPGPLSSDTAELEQPNTAAVARYAYGFSNASSLGALLTARDGSDYHNYVAGIDGRWRPNDQHTFEFQHLVSDTAYPQAVAEEYEQPLGDFDGDATRLAYEFATRNWFANLHHVDFSSGFRADSGFVTQVGGTKRELSGGRVWHGAVDDWWSQIRLFTNIDDTVSESGELLERRKALRFGVGGPMQSWFQVALVDAEEYWEGVHYDLRKLRAYYAFQPRSGLSIEMLGATGDQIDYTNNRAADELRFEPSITWNLSRNLLLRFRGVFARLETKDGERIFDAIAADTRLTWQFNLRSFLRLTVQGQNLDRNPAVYIDPVDDRARNVGRQLLYSYKLNPQTVFFIGYADHHVDEDDFDALLLSDRTWFMKIGYAWVP